MAHLPSWNDRYQDKRWSQDDRVKMYRFEKDLEKKIDSLYNNIKRVDLEPFIESNEPWKMAVINQMCNKHGVKAINMTKKVESENQLIEVKEKMEQLNVNNKDNNNKDNNNKDNKNKDNKKSLLKQNVKSNTLSLPLPDTKKTYITLVLGKLSKHRLG
jgi:hypothetical protein